MKIPFKDCTLKEMKNILELGTIHFDKDVDPKMKDYIYWVLQFNPKNRPTCQEMLKHSLFDIIRSTQKTNLAKVG